VLVVFALAAVRCWEEQAIPINNAGMIAGAVGFFRPARAYCVGLRKPTSWALFWRRAAAGCIPFCGLASLSSYCGGV
jgi:hypothetical protein